MLTLTLALPSACNSEQAAVVALGFTQLSWDNLSGQEPQPSSWMYKFWHELTGNEKAAVTLLGYNKTTWDNDSGSEPQPTSIFKRWDKLTACGEDEHDCIPRVSPGWPLPLWLIYAEHYFY